MIQRSWLAICYEGILGGLNLVSEVIVWWEYDFAKSDSNNKEWLEE